MHLSQERLISSGLAPWQGPAVFFHNSARFGPGDLEQFTRSVGNSAKAGDCSKIGQFGLGAITAYHFTDVIQLLTGLACVGGEPSRAISGIIVSS